MKKTIAVIIALIVAIAPASEARAPRVKYYYRPDVAMTAYNFALAFHQLDEQISALIGASDQNNDLLMGHLAVLKDTNLRSEDYAQTIELIYSFHLLQPEAFNGNLHLAGDVLLQRNVYSRALLYAEITHPISQESLNLAQAALNELNAFDSFVHLLNGD